MPKIYIKILLIVFYLIIVPEINSQTFTVGSASANYNLSCINTVITMTTNSGNTPYSYTWTVPGSTINGIYANVTLPGTWTVTGKNLTTSVTTQQTFTISQSVQAPTITITPTVQSITCNVAASCYTLTSNLNPWITTNWYRVIGSNTVYVGVPQGTINVFCPTAPGIYWGESVNDLTGCKTTQSVQVAASLGVPSFSVTSPSNFILGCGSSSITSMQVPIVVTSPVLNTPVSYTFLPPTSTVIITPTSNLGSNPNQNNITTPGTWTVYVKDLTNNCLVSLPVNIISNTTTPSAYIAQPVSTLNCFQSPTILTGISSNTNTTMSWTVFPSSVVNSSSLAVSSNSAIAGSDFNITSVSTYTLGVTNNINQCVGTKTLMLMQDIRKPSLTAGAITNSVISCNNSSVVIVPSISFSVSLALNPSLTWYAPTSTIGVAGSSYTTFLPGTHSVIATSAVNGCTALAIYNVASDLAVGAIGGSVGISCPVTTAAISPTITTSPSAITFSWSGAPGSIISAVNQSSISINALGTYTCIITNTVNGCNDTIYCTAVCNTGLFNYNFTNGISVFPNPSNGSLNIELPFTAPNFKFIVYDLQGKIILESYLNSKLNKLETNLTDGFYLYSIIRDNVILRKDKLIIE